VPGLPYGKNLSFRTKGGHVWKLIIKHDNLNGTVWFSNLRSLVSHTSNHGRTYFLSVIFDLTWDSVLSKLW
jgi:hypothetical protein